MAGPVKTAPLTPEQQRASVIWQVLRAGYLRVAAHAAGKHPGELTVSEQNQLLDPWFVAMEHDLAQLEEVVRQGQRQTAQEIQRGLHRADGLDHAMVDEAVEYALAPAKERL